MISTAAVPNWNSALYISTNGNLNLRASSDKKITPPKPPKEAPKELKINAKYDSRELGELLFPVEVTVENVKRAIFRQADFLDNKSVDEYFLVIEYKSKLSPLTVEFIPIRDSHEVVRKCIKKNEVLNINVVSKNPEKSTKKEFKRFASMPSIQRPKPGGGANPNMLQKKSSFLNKTSHISRAKTSWALEANSGDSAGAVNGNNVDNKDLDLELKPKKISSKSKSSRGFSGIKSKSKLKMSDGAIKRNSEQIQNPFYVDQPLTEAPEETSPRTEPPKKRAASNPPLPDKRSSVKLPSETSPRKVELSVTITAPLKDTKVTQITEPSSNVKLTEDDKIGSKEKLIEEESPKKKDKKKSFRRSKKEGNNE
jgi:hypothetical protein